MHMSHRNVISEGVELGSRRSFAGCFAAICLSDRNANRRITSRSIYISLLILLLLNTWTHHNALSGSHLETLPPKPEIILFFAGGSRGSFFSSFDLSVGSGGLVSQPLWNLDLFYLLLGLFGFRGLEVLGTVCTFFHMCCFVCRL